MLLKRSRFLVLAFVLLGLTFNAGWRAQAKPALTGPLPAGGTDRLVVWFEPAVTESAVQASGLPLDAAAHRGEMAAATANLSASSGLALTLVREEGSGGQVVKLGERLPADEVQALADQLARQPGVLRAEPDWIVQPAAESRSVSAPNDFWWFKLWGLQPYQVVNGVGLNAGIDAPAAWAITTGDPNLLVAVLDTGILKEHEDLAGRWTGGYDFIDILENAGDGDRRDPDASDPGDFCGEGSRSSWHGSHVAGTIGARSNNFLGVTGINWESKILPVRVLGRCAGYSSDTAAGIRWAAGDNSLVNVPYNPDAGRVKVINLSLGGSYRCPSYMQAAIDYARARGVVVVAAAGNSGMDARSYMPGNCNGVITVGASTQNGALAAYSNNGSLVEISAPGGQIGPGNDNDNGILSTVDYGWQSPQGSDYTSMNGTSMAAPHVAGIVSLMYSANPGLSVDLVQLILQRTASPFAATSPCSQVPNLCGAGIANAGRAVSDASGLRVVQWPTMYGRYGQSHGGNPAAPGQIQVVTSAANNPSKTSVQIGGVEAKVLSVTSRDGRDTLTVQPGVMPQIGRYDLQVKIDNAVYLQPQSVFFGPLIYFPVVSR